MAPKRLEKRKKPSADDDPFWDNWEELSPSPEPVARRPKPSKHRKKYKQLTGSVDDPFGYDGFGDTWEKKTPARRIVRRDSSPVVLPEELSALYDDGESWCTSAKKKWNHEEHLKVLNAKHARLDAERKAKALLEAKAKEEKQLAEAAEAAKKAEAKAEWNRQVELARRCIALANPAQASSILYSLSQNLKIIHHIDQEAKKEVSELYSNLHYHWDLQQLLSHALAGNNSDNKENESIDENNESSIESSIGGDTVKVNRSSILEEESSEIATGSTTLVAVDRLPTYLSKTKDRSSSTIFDGDTVKAGEESRNETGSATVVVDRCKKDCCSRDEENSNENSSGAFRNRASSSAAFEPRAALVEANDNRGSLPFKHNN